MIDSTAAGALRRPESVPRMPRWVSDQYPRRNPLACGALGRYDPALVRRDRTALGGRDVRRPRGRRVRSCCLDRPANPLAGRGARRGSPGAKAAPPSAASPPGRTRRVSSPRAGSWSHGERRRVHSSVSGVAPIYYVEHAGAVYFASRIDPLVQALPRRYTIDWRAWASIFYLRFPIGERTPFREVKRLRPFSTLEWDAGTPGGKARQHRWPWAEVEPSLDLEAGAGASSRRCGRRSRPSREGPSSARSAVAGTPGSCSACWPSRARRPSGRDGEPGQRPPPRGGARGGGRDEPRSAAHSTLEGDPRRSGTTRASAPCGWTSSSPRRPGRCRWQPRSGTARRGDRRPRAGHARTGGHALLHGIDDPARRHPRRGAGAVDSPSGPGHAACHLAHPVAGARRRPEGRSPGASSWTRQAGSAATPPRWC